MTAALFKTTAVGALLAAALLHAPLAVAQDGEVSKPDFRPYVDETYDAWDTNADDLLGEDEFYAGLFGTWDEDKDAIVTRDEYERGYASWFNDLKVEGAGYDELAGREQQLMQETLTTAAGEAGIYEAWAGTAEPVDRETFADIMFERIAGDDARLSEDEFEMIYPR